MAQQANNFYDKWAKNISANEGMLISAFWLITVMVISSAAMGVEDFATSYNGYESFPSNKVFPWVIWFVALLPQGVQMLSGYFAIGTIGMDANDASVKRYRYFGMTIWFLAWLVDGYLDFIYKSQGVSSDMGPKIAMESWLLYGVGSEVLFSLTFPVFIKLLSPGLEATFSFLEDFVETVVGIVGLIAGLVKRIADRVYAGLTGADSGGKRKKKTSSPKAGRSNRSKRGGQPSRGTRPNQPSGDWGRPQPPRQHGGQPRMPTGQPRREARRDS